MTVRRMGPWMYPVDERVLEHLSNESWASPSTMASDSRFQQLGVDEGYIRQRCEQLVNRELIAPIIEDSDMYEITSMGLAYLDGNCDARYLPNWSVRYG